MCRSFTNQGDAWPTIYRSVFAAWEPTSYRASWQTRQSATDHWLQWRSSRVLNKLLASATKSRHQSTAGRRGHTQKGKPAREEARRCPIHISTGH
ncbi:hypothetical protein AVEN_200090-1 [Araneus ventricosus]|uniref:Uncharacterized protein n=1 Tax=Araneus ventricosus TaxID=182803 RepID=A0A4Y2V0K0_ARAVE|nr:hypothetical protein AVEN_200090-1 [Araneus ventricosus]